MGILTAPLAGQDCRRRLFRDILQLLFVQFPFGLIPELIITTFGAVVFYPYFLRSLANLLDRCFCHVQLSTQAKHSPALSR